nr:phospholipase A2 inhibitor and Ly6/PLAUR domain-containing protein-like [Anolis sagrei ordinatus]
MKTLPGYFLIFAFLMSQGEPLKCETCNQDGYTCRGPHWPCDDHFKTCVVVLVEHTHYGKPQLRTVKTCEHTRLCNRSMSYLNMGQGRYERSSIVCCIGEACKTAVPRFQPELIKPNGKSCPACFAPNTTGCGSARVDCSGNEDFCLNTMQRISVGNTKF